MTPGDPVCPRCWWSEGGRCYSEALGLTRDADGRAEVTTAEKRERCIATGARRRNVLASRLCGQREVTGG